LECEKNCDAAIQPELVICKETKEALSLAKQEAKDEVIVVIGSLYLVGEIKQIYTKK